MGYDPKIHHRRSIRLAGYDYARPAGYFITLVTQDRACLFGEVEHDHVCLSSLGRIAYDEWFRSAALRKEICLFQDEFVVMPNHIHAIVWLVDDLVGADGARPALNGRYPR